MNHKQDIIINPILSEKSHSLAEQFNQYVFRVNPKSNKLEIKDSIEKRFEVKVINVTTMNFKGKNKNITIKSDGHVIRTSGNRSNWKKAIVTLKKGQSIDLGTGI